MCVDFNANVKTPTAMQEQSIKKKICSENGFHMTFKNNYT